MDGVIDINGFGTNDETLKRHSEPDLLPRERYIIGAAARLRGGLFPAWMSFRGFYLVVTDQSLLIYRHHRMTSAPSGLVRRIGLDGIHRRGIKTDEANTQLNADIPIVDGALLRLTFLGAEKANGKRVVVAISG